MKILVIGSGGREHALGWRLASSGHEVIAAPGNPGLETLGAILPIGVDDAAALTKAAIHHRVELVVVGPEAPLVAGLADRLRNEGIAVFGPGADGARLEGSKAYSKQFFERHGIRTAPFVVARGHKEAQAAVAELGGEVVVKIDGLAAGKGVVVCASVADAHEAIDELRARFGDNAETLIVERRIAGRELSVMALCDGKRTIRLAQAEDHKQLEDGDRGPNTGGMGTVSPASWASDELLERIDQEIFAPTVAGLVADGIDYRGVLYAGLMVDGDEVPWLLEYNCRFGDPETQPVMMRMRADLGAALLAAACGDLRVASIEWDPRVAVCVVMATAGYPRSSEKGVPIRGVESVSSDEIVVFHAGTKHVGEELVTAGGRVLGVTAIGEDVQAARARAYAAVSAIDLRGAQYRHDIGARRAGESADE